MSHIFLFWRHSWLSRVRHQLLLSSGTLFRNWVAVFCSRYDSAMWAADTARSGIFARSSPAERPRRRNIVSSSATLWRLRLDVSTTAATAATTSGAWWREDDEDDEMVETAACGRSSCVALLREVRGVSVWLVRAQSQAATHQRRSHCRQH